jgi:hypothetical protein
MCNTIFVCTWVRWQAHILLSTLRHIFRIYHTMRGNDLCHVRCYESHLRGYTPYAHGLLPGPTKWVIRQITYKRKSSNLLSIQSNKWFFHIIYYLLCMLIMQVSHDSGYKPDTSWKTRLWSEDATPVVCPIPVGRHDYGRMSDSDRKIWLRSHFPTPVDVTTLVVSPDSSRASRLRSMSVPQVLPTHLWNTMHGRARWLHHLTARTLSQKQFE